MTVRRLLLRIYPRSWRVEYGDELADVLARKPLTLPVMLDVVRNGVWQHLRRDAPWAICGFALALWTLTMLVLSATHLFPLETLRWMAIASHLFVMVAAAWTIAREKCGIWRGLLASFKTTGIGAAVLAIWVPAYMLARYGAVVGGHGVWYWTWLNLRTVGQIDLFLGLTGAVTARLGNLLLAHLFHERPTLQ